MEKSIKEEIQKLKELRERKEKLQKLYNEAVEEFRQLNSQLLADLEQNKEELQEQENKAREWAIKQYEATGQKKLDFGLGIRVEKVLQYDAEKAFTWAMEHKMALQLDKKTFEKIAKTQPPEFVAIYEQPKATIPKEIELDKQEQKI